MMLLLIVTHLLAIIAGLPIGMWWRETHPRKVITVHTPDWFHRMTNSRRAGVTIVLVAVLIQVVVAILLVVTRAQASQASKDATAATERLRQVLVCQVLHNTLTSQGLGRRDEAASESRHAQIVWINTVIDGIQGDTLTGPSLLSSLRTWRTTLLGLDHTVEANPYPAGGLCTQLLTDDEKALLEDLRKDARG